MPSRRNGAATAALERTFYLPPPHGSSRRFPIRFLWSIESATAVCAVVITRHDDDDDALRIVNVCVRTLLLVGDDSKTSSVLGRMRRVLISAATGR